MSDPSKREITDVSSDLPIQQAIGQINKALARLEGMAKRYNHVYYEVDAMRSGLGLEQYYTTRKELGHSDFDYSDWTLFDTDDGFNIWKYPVAAFSYDAHNQLREDDKIIDYMGEAVVAQGSTFNKVYLLSGGVYTDNTAEASSAEGTPFDLNGGTSEELLIGNDTVFSGVDFTFFKPGSGYALAYHYSKTEGWGSGTSGTDILKDDATNNLRRDGLTRFDFPGDWKQSNINGSTLYWLRIFSTTTPTQRAQAYAVEPSHNIKNLLSLSNEQLNVLGTRKWCSFDQDIYVTIRNTGDLRYHGNLFLRSGANISTRKSYFITNHTYELDYKNNGYTQRLPSRSRLAFTDEVATSLSKRYVHLASPVVGTRGHRLTRSGELTGIAVTAGTAPTGDALTFVVRKNSTDTIISGILLAGETASHKTNFNPVTVAAGDAVQVWCGQTSAGAYDNIGVDVEFTEVSV